MSIVLYNFMFSISELLLYYCQVKIASSFLNLNAYIITTVPKPMWKEKSRNTYYNDAIPLILHKL